MNDKLNTYDPAWFCKLHKKKIKNQTLDEVVKMIDDFSDETGISYGAEQLLILVNEKVKSMKEQGR